MPHDPTKEQNETLFDISAASEVVTELDPKRQGCLTFSVTNKSDQSLQSKAEIVPLGSSNADWFNFQGDAIRDFNEAGTGQYTVEINVPEIVSRGTYRFRLDVYSMENPNAKPTEGPIITFEVPKGSEPEPFNWKPLAVIAALLLVCVGGVFWWITRPDALEADFSVAQLSGVAPFEVQFTNASTGEIANYKWDFGDGKSSTESDPKHIYAEAGTYSVLLTISQEDKTMKESEPRVITVEQPLQALISASRVRGSLPLNVSFKSVSTGKIASVNWDFGDGKKSTKAEVTHKYTSAKTFKATLTVTGEDGSTNSNHVNIQVVQEKRKVPSRLVGKKFSQVHSKLSNAGFEIKVKTVKTTNRAKHETVASVSPKSGSLQPFGSTVTVNVFGDPRIKRTDVFNPVKVIHVARPITLPLKPTPRK